MRNLMLILKRNLKKLSDKNHYVRDSDDFIFFHFKRNDDVSCGILGEINSLYIQIFHAKKIKILYTFNNENTWC